MAWWRSNSSTDPRGATASGKIKPTRRSVLEEQASSIKQLTRGCRTLVVAFRHLAVHSHFAEVKKYKRALDDLDLDLTDGEVPSEREFRQAAAGLVQELLHLHRSREKVLGNLLEEISSVVYKGAREDDEARSQLQESIKAIAEATELDNMKDMVGMIRGQVSEMQENVKKQQERERARAEALDQELGQMLGQLKQAEQDLQMDALTGVCSRRWLDEFLGAQLPADEDDVLCLIMCDIDHFKSVNDTHGHDVGDEVLKVMGRCLNEVVMRKSDYVARFGGEEFAVLLDESNLQGGVAVAERIRKAVEALIIPVGETTLRVTASFGVAAAMYGETAKDLFQRADGALYVAKRNGRNRVEAAAGQR